MADPRPPARLTETSGPWIDALPIIVKAGTAALIGLGVIVAGIYTIGGYATKIDLIPTIHSTLRQHTTELNAQMRELIRLQRVTCRALAKSEATREQCDDYRAWSGPYSSQ